ncbi:amidohydrolase family protein [Streptomyces sp. NPDC001118]
MHVFRWRIRPAPRGGRRGTDSRRGPAGRCTQIATAIDRSNPESQDPPLDAREGLTRLQSLVMHTTGTAYQLHDAASGTLRPGRRADLIVLDRDITKIPVKGSRVRYTLISGRVVHDAGSQTGRARAEAAQRMGALGAGRAPGDSCCRGH